MVGQQKNGDTMTRQTNINEARLMKENLYLEGYRKAWHALWQELTTVGDGLISGEDVIKMMSRIEENKLPPAEGDEQ